MFYSRQGTILKTFGVVGFINIQLLMPKKAVRKCIYIKALVGCHFLPFAKLSTGVNYVACVGL